MDEYCNNTSFDVIYVDDFGIKNQVNTYISQPIISPISPLIIDTTFNHNEISNMSDDLSIDSENVCIICYDKEINIMFDNCKHTCVCNNCLNLLKAVPLEYKCPLCRMIITNVTHILNV